MKLVSPLVLMTLCHQKACVGFSCLGFLHTILNTLPPKTYSYCTLSSTATFSCGGRTFGSFHNGFVRSLTCAGHATLSPLTENVLSHGSFNSLNSLPSPLSVESSGNHYSLHNPCHSMDQLKFSRKCIPSALPHSFPDSQDYFKISLPPNCPSTFANMAGDIGSKVSGSLNGRHTSMVVSNGQQVELNGGGMFQRLM